MSDTVTANNRPRTSAATYDASSITVLEGLEAVRKRPGMYIGGVDSAGFHHLLWEIVDNAVDEVLNGHATRISVTLAADGKSATVTDNGRGIPVDIHPKTGRSALEVIFTTLHAGGKFDNDAYKVSGGLHGVGASVVNALSSELIVDVKRDGHIHRQVFHRGKPEGDVRKVEPARGTGTTVTFTPDHEIFRERSFDAKLVAERLDVKAYLNKGLSIQFTDQASGQSTTFHHAGGVADYLDALQAKNEDPRVAPTPFVLEQAQSADGLRVDLALAWTESTSEAVTSYVNTIPTRDGGTHEQGLREAVHAGVRMFLTKYELVKKGLEVKSEDIREGLTAVLSVCLGNPQFQGQTKDRLNNPEARSAVESLIRPRLEAFLLANKSIGDAIADRVLRAARAREASRAAAAQVRRKTPTNNRLNLPGKLHDCDTNNAEHSELFIVEGDSAGGSAKQGRDRHYQAILPLKGKVLNAEQAGKSKVVDNKELSDIVAALGCGMDDRIDRSRLRYGKIIFLTDADSDGHHIATLLITFFYRHLRSLIEEGRVYLACPPLYKITWGQQTFWAADDKAKASILKQLPENAKPNITRFKGLGEMPAKLLFETTLDPARRRLLRVTLPENDVPYAERTITELMGKEADARYRFIISEAYTASEEELDV
jgi:DNA gyrase subunit B/topoisomerase-4 subunit B